MKSITIEYKKFCVVQYNIISTGKQSFSLRSLVPAYSVLLFGKLSLIVLL